MIDEYITQMGNANSGMTCENQRFAFFDHFLSVSHPKRSIHRYSQIHLDITPLAPNVYYVSCPMQAHLNKPSATRAPQMHA